MRPVSLQPITKGLAFARYTTALAHCQNDYGSAGEFASKQWPDQPVIASVLKTAVSAGTAVATGWSEELVHSGLASDFVEALRAEEVVNRLPGVRRDPLNTRVPVEVTGTDGTWIGPGAAIPVAGSNFTTKTLQPFKAGSISLLDDELVRLATPRAVATIQRSMVAGAVRYLDRQFLDPTAAAVADVSPGSVTNGATQVVSTGTTAAAMTTDFSAMIAAADELNSPCWVMNARTCATIAGTLQIPGIKVTGGELFGISIICSRSSPAPAGSPPMPRLITLIDGSAILLADEGVADVKLTSVAAVQANDAPTNNSATPTETSMVSLYQISAWAARVVRQISWARTRTTGVVWMEVTY